ncbi:polysaccharide biosynthesis protein [Aliamphritea hakodatensis]|uniref:polysaccharide biosynthesis protein n=1 Tax=Aliamphritea hakodatensis TaxID=2895352 RepID=UPI0022FD8C60|nr:nucleoside-diphosphate sugar epimerase/dehydratase [Aliamphritea hakodatensis]
MTFFNRLSRSQKRFLFIFSDSIFLILCCWFSFSLRYGELLANDFVHWPAYLLAPFIGIPVFWKLGLYRAVTRYIGNKTLWIIVKAISLHIVLWATVVHLMGLPEAIPRSVIFIYWFVAIVAVGGMRMLVRWVILSQLPARERLQPKAVEKVLIYGAGSAGRQLATALFHSDEYKIVAYIDDDLGKVGSDIHGVRVYSYTDIDLLIAKFTVDAVLLALPSASTSRRKQIVDSLADERVRVLTLPGLSDLAGGKVTISDVREIDIADLLGREEVKPHQNLLDRCILNQRVLITGAGGSIGSELCRQIIAQQPTTVVIYELTEFALYSIERELRLVLPEGIQLIPILGNVLDKAMLEQVMTEYAIDTVYHAAAYKHVPLVEANILAGVRNNLLGTWYTAEAAIKCGVKNFVLISTDKAVRPTNVMGASKRFAELVLQGLALREKETSAIRFAMVRFGNVLGSSGSVIPLFKQQIQDGGPVTVTHPEITRYFMTIPEAACLVLQAGSMGCSGDVFVLDMGEPVKIKSLAKKMINLSGHSVKDEGNPDGEIEIVFSGLRDGEKLYEELLIGDNVQRTEHEMIMRASEVMLSWDELEKVLADMRSSLDEFAYDRVRTLLLEVVNGYNPQHEIRDLIYTKQQQRIESEAQKLH